MMSQDDRRLQTIRISGCYFCSFGKLAEEVTGKKLDEEMILKVYAESVVSSAMKWNCYIRRPDEVFYLFLYELGERGHRVYYVGWWNSDMQGDNPEMFNRWNPKDITHEVIRRIYKDHPNPKKREHHFGLHNWNPLPQLECGPLNGKRFFRVERAGRMAA